MSLMSTAYAMAPSGQAGGGEGSSLLGTFAPMLLMLVVFYFLLIRPQQKRAKEHKVMLENIKRNDEVVTAGGLYGRVIEVNGDKLVVDLGDSKVTVGRSFITAVVQVKAPASDNKNKTADK